MSDLKTDNVRGYLAEFMVAHAVGAVAPRVEWDSWDVTSPDGVRIEVKTSGYIQAWAQKKLSVPTFRVAPAYGWEASTGTWSGQQSLNAHVYVFCLHTATSHDTYDPLDTSQWKFYVASRTAEERTTRQMGLATLRKVAGDPVTYGAGWATGGDWPTPSRPCHIHATGQLKTSQDNRSCLGTFSQVRRRSAGKPAGQR